MLLNLIPRDNTAIRPTMMIKKEKEKNSNEANVCGKTKKRPRKDIKETE